MLKKLLIFIIALAPIAAVAQDLKLAYINTQEVFAAMPELSGIETQLTEKQEQITKNGQALVEEYNKKAEEFESTSATASEALKQDQMAQLQSIQQRYQMFLQNSQQEMDQLQQQLLGPVNQKISDAIQAIGAANNYTFVFDVSNMQSPIVYTHPTATNITQEVKTRLGVQ
ncbi:MAG: OmpH family outer membrane protein [Fermentimonas sp.]|nr:OmpH family outer membrane protein [Fermentimonas sp.]